MTWLLALYPPRWRRRYGGELRELLASQRFSLRTVADLIAGAIDAWIAPQPIHLQPSTNDKNEGVTMLGTMLKLGCTGSAVKITREDARKSAVITLGGTLVLTAIWMTLHTHANRNYSNAFVSMAFLAPYLLSLRYTTLKGRSAATQTIFIGGMILILMLFIGAAGWLASRI